MSEAPVEQSEHVEAPEAAPAARQPRPTPPAWRAAAITLAAALVLVVALVTTAPLWAGLLPWGPAATARRRDEALAARMDRLQTAQDEAQQQASREAASAAATLQQIAARVAALKATAAAPAGDIAQLRRQQTALSAAVAALDNRVGAAEKALSATDAAATQRRLATLSATVADLGNRQHALDKALQARVAFDARGAALALAVLQIRDAVAAGRPFAAPYATLAAAARGRPELAAAVNSLAGPAKTGVATQAALVEGLRRLAATGSSSDEPTPETRSWTAAMLARLRGLVRIQRVDDSGATASPPGMAIDAARADLADGDLAGAVAAIDELSGPPAAAAKPWLQKARQRLAVDDALRRIGSVATAQLGAANDAGAAAPAGAPR